MKIFALIYLLIAAGTSAFADSSPKVFDLGMRAGRYESDSVYEDSKGTLLDVSGALVLGDSFRSNLKLDLDLMAKVRDGQGDFSDANVTLKGRYLKEGRWGFEVSGLPFKYSRDDIFYELSFVEVSAVLKIAEGKGHQLLALAGINPFTTRNSLNTYESTETATAKTRFATLEYSVRLPISIEYKYKRGKKLTITAIAHYVLRAGRDSLNKVETYGIRVPQVTELEHKNFLGHNLAGVGEINYRLTNSRGKQLLLNGTVQAELDSHVQDFGVQVSRVSTRLMTMAGVIVRF